MNTDNLKICTCCKIPKSRDDFHAVKVNKDKLRSYCKTCHNKKRKECDDKIKASGVHLRTVSKTCRKCNLELPAKYFNLGSRQSDGLHSYCKFCQCCLQLEKRNTRYQKSKRVLTMELMQQEYFKLIDGYCVYCGHEGGSIDRVQNQQTYKLSNCVSCCVLCNIAKGKMTVEQWYEFTKRFRYPVIHKHEIPDDVDLIGYF
jgi:hypothetical protein